MEKRPGLLAIIGALIWLTQLSILAQPQDNLHARVDTLYQLGQRFSELGQWPEAITAYQQALEISPNRKDVHIGLGHIYRQNGVWEKALEQYEKALQSDPGDSIAAPFAEVCRKALQEQKDRGFVRAETLQQMAEIAQEPSSGTKGIGGYSGFQTSPTAPLHIEFGFGKFTFADLSPNGREQLHQGALFLQTPEWRGKKILIEGHTCSCGSHQSNQALSQKRAQAVRDYLVGQGAIPADSVSTIGYGAGKPLAATPRKNLSPLQCESDPVHSMNRRVVIRQWRAEDATLPPSSPMQVSFWYRPRGTNEPFALLTDGAILHSGDEVQILMVSEQPINAYIFHRGSASDWTCLFPNEAFCLEAPAVNPLEPGRKYWLPGFGRGLPLDHVPGPEETFVYLSPEPDPKLERWAKEAKEAKDSMRLRGIDSISTADWSTTSNPPDPEPEISAVDWSTRLRFHHAP